MTVADPMRTKHAVRQLAPQPLPDHIARCIANAGKGPFHPPAPKETRE